MNEGQRRTCVGGHLESSPGFDVYKYVIGARKVETQILLDLS